MKRVIYLWSIIIASLILAGCSKKTVMIGEMDMDFTNVDFKDGRTGNQVTLNTEQSVEIYNTLEDIEFVKEGTNESRTGWDYWIAFMKDSELVKEFGIHGNDILEYDGYLYKAKDASIDTDYFNSYFYTTFHARVIGTESGLLISPDNDTMEASSSDKISVGLNGTKIYDQNNNEIDQDDLMLGDRIKITYNGMIAESYPAQISAHQIEVVERNIIIEGYLAIIDDLYKDDSALNSDIALIAFDTSEWINLTDEEKQAILTIVRDRYGFEVIEGTFDELAEEGLIDKDKLYFPNGILIKISELDYNEKKQVLSGSMKKWRSGSGAIGADFKAKFEENTWTITKENMWIS